MAMTKAVDALALKFALVSGAGADTNMAISGIETVDTLVFVEESATSSADPTDRTSTTSITTDGNIQCTAATTSDKLMVLWHDASASGIDALALKSTVIAGADANTNMAITGIKTNDTLFDVIEAAQTTSLLTDRTSTSSITSDGNIQSTTAFTNTTSDWAIVLYHDASTAGIDSPCLKWAQVAGSATTSTVTGIATEDSLIAVIELSVTDNIPTDRTSTTTITAADTITSGTSTVNDTLLVLWHDASA